MKLCPDADSQSFKGSAGWLMKFNQSQGIKSIQLRGEILSANTSSVGPFRQQLEKVIAEKDYSRDQIYNVDEMVLW